MFAGEIEINERECGLSTAALITEVAIKEKNSNVNRERGQET